MDYYSEVKNNGIRTFEGKWIELEKHITLREVTQIQKVEHVMYTLMSGY